MDVLEGRNFFLDVDASSRLLCWFGLGLLLLRGEVLFLSDVYYFRGGETRFDGFI